MLLTEVERNYLWSIHIRGCFVPANVDIFIFAEKRSSHPLRSHGYYFFHHHPAVIKF